MSKKSKRLPKKKPVKKAKKEEVVPKEELSQEEVEQLMVDLEQFQNDFLEKLAKTNKFEIVPTHDEHGNILTEEQLSLIKRELNRLGLITIYTFDLNNRFTVLLCPDKDKMRIGMISNGAEVH